MGLGSGEYPDKQGKSQVWPCLVWDPYGPGVVGPSTTEKVPEGSISKSAYLRAYWSYERKLLLRILMWIMLIDESSIVIVKDFECSVMVGIHCNEDLRKRIIR